MYLAEYGDDDAGIRQLLVRFPAFVDEATPAAREWRKRLRDAVRVVASHHDVDVSVRIVLIDGRLERQVWLNGPSQDDAFARTLAATFLRLNDGADVLAALAADRAEHDAALALAPACALRLAREPARHGEQEFVHHFRLLDALPALGATALGARVPLCWQATFHACAPSLEERRFVQRRQIALEHLAGIPAALREQQEAISRRFSDVAYLVTECLFVGPEIERTVRDIVANAWDDGPGRVGLPRAEMEVMAPDDESEALRCGLSPALFRAFGPVEALAAAASVDDAVAAIAWQPPPSWRAGKLANATKMADAVEGYLQQIEVRLARLEEELKRRQAADAECAELRKAVSISRADPAFALVKARQILEKLVRRLYRMHRPDVPEKALLFDMIRDLTGQSNRPSVLPRHIGHYLDTIRVLGNLEAHGVAGDAAPGGAPGLSRNDVELSLLMMLNVVEWFALEHAPGRDAAD